MKKIILGCLGLIASIAIAGCSQPSYHSIPVFNKPKTVSGKQCVQRCSQQKTHCDKRCGSDHQQCLARQKTFAHDRYIHYVNQSVQNGTKIERKEGDFIDYAACASACNCIKSYKNCYTLCGGAVTERQVCVKNCN